MAINRSTRLPDSGKVFDWDKLSSRGIYLFAAAAPFSNAAMEIVIGCLTFIWFARMFFEKRILFKLTYTTIFIVVYLAAMLVSGFLSIRPVQSALMIQWEWIVLLYFVILNTMPSRKVFLDSVKILAVSCSIVSVYAIWQHFTGVDIIRQINLPGYSGFHRSGGFFGFCLTFGGFFVMAYIVTLGSFLGSVDRRTKILLGVSSLLMFLAVIASYTRSSWFGALAGTIILTFAYRWKTGVLFVVLIMLFWTGVYFIHPTLITEFGLISIVDPNYSEGSQMRMDLWIKGLLIWRDFPVLGIGQGNFRIYQDIYDFPESIYGFGHLHNELLNVAVQLGIVGLLSFLGIWIMFFLECYRFWRRERESNHYLAASVLGCGCATAGILAAGFFQCFFTDIEVGMMWWFIAGLGSAVIYLPPDGDTL